MFSADWLASTTDDVRPQLPRLRPYVRPQQLTLDHATQSTPEHVTQSSSDHATQSQAHEQDYGFLFILAHVAKESLRCLAFLFAFPGCMLLLLEAQLKESGLTCSFRAIMVVSTCFTCCGLSSFLAFSVSSPIYNNDELRASIPFIFIGYFISYSIVHISSINARARFMVRKYMAALFSLRVGALDGNTTHWILPFFSLNCGIFFSSAIYIVKTTTDLFPALSQIVTVLITLRGMSSLTVQSIGFTDRKMMHRIFPSPLHAAEIINLICLAKEKSAKNLDRLLDNLEAVRRGKTTISAKRDLPNFGVPPAALPDKMPDSRKTGLHGLKTLKPGTMGADEFLEEARFMDSLQHPNILRLWGICKHEDKISILIEYMHLGNLEQILTQQRKGEKDVFTNKEELTILIKCARGLAYLHSQNIIHRDIRARNFLLDKCHRPVISDFGRSRHLESTMYHETSRIVNNVPVYWDAPESLTENQYSFQSDVWSFGVMMWEVKMQQLPFMGEHMTKVVAEILSDDRRLEIKDEWLVAPVLRSCWQKKPSDRPMVPEIEESLDKLLVPLQTVDPLFI